MRTMSVAALLMEIQDVQAIGAGSYVNCTFYWDANEGTRSFTKAVQPAMPSRGVPNMVQGCYGAALHYLKAVTALGPDRARDGAAVCAAMKAMPTRDEAFGANIIRQDGLCMLPAFLYQMKSGSESTGPWDLQKLVATTPPERAWKPLAEEGCSIAPS